MTQPFRNISVLLTANNTQLKTALAQSSTAVRAFDSDVSKSNRSLATAGNLMKVGLAAGATAAAAGLLYATTKAIAFDKAMRNVNSLTGASEKDFAALEKRVVEMSKTLPQSATVLAEGLYDIASSGFQGAEGMTVLKAAAEGASAGLTTTAVSAKAVTAVLNAYGRPAKDSADVMDALFQTVNLGVISFEELAGSIGDVVGLAAPVGVSIDQLGAAIATMTTQGVGGSESATLLVNVFTKMLRPSEALATHMKTLGYESGEAMLKANGLRGTMELLRESTGGNITALMELFPDIQAARGALALMANEGENYASASAKIEDAEARRGATSRTLAEQMKSVSAQATLAKNQLDAMAITAGVKLLPAVLGLIEGGRELGAALRDDVGSVIEALAPTWSNLADVVRDTWEVFVALGDAFGPIAGGLATLAVGGVVVTLNALTTVLSTLTGFLADNSEIAVILATALGIHLLGGVAALTTKIQVGLVVAIYESIGAMTAAAGVAGGMSLAMVGAAAGLAGVALVVGGAILAFQGYRDGAGQAKDALAEWNQAQNADGIKAQVEGIHELNGDLDGMTERLEQLDSRGLLSNIFNVKAASEELGLRRNIEAVAEAAESAQQDLANLQGAVVRYEAEARGMSGIDAFKEFGTAEQGAKLLADRLPLLAKAGVQVGDSFTVVKQKIDAYKQSQAVGEDATVDLIDALGALADGAEDTEDALDALKDALDRIVGVFLSADEATIAFEQALDDLAAVTKDSTKELDFNSEAGRKNRQAIIDGVSALTGQIDASARAGESAEQLSKRLTDGRTRLVESGIAAGFSRESMEALMNQYNLTPELVSTIVEEVGSVPTMAAMAGVKRKAEELDRLKPKVKVGADVTGALGDIDKLMGYIESRKGKVRVAGVNSVGGVTVGDGPGRGGAALARIRASLPPGLNVSSTYRSPAQNAAVGGAPGSYHTDRQNPAVDIVGSTGQLNSYYRTLRAMGGWRELLWRVPGHYDHIHAAAMGGAINGPGTGTSDSIPAWLSNGEHVWTSKEVTAAGGHGAVEHLRATISGKAIMRAGGGPVNPVPRGQSFMGLAQQYGKRADGADRIETLIRDWERYNQLIDRAAERLVLVRDVTKKVEGASKALADFDRAAQVDNQRVAVDRLVESLRKQKDAEEERARVSEEKVRAEVALRRNMHEMGVTNDAAYLRRLTTTLNAEKKHSDAWMDIYRERQAILDAVEDRQKEALEKLNGMLQQESAINKQIAAAQTQYSERVASANARAQESIESLIESRRDAILSWMRLDDQMQSRGSSFALTSDDEQGARSALRAAGLLTAAMAAWDDSQADGPMSASALILNAREQTYLIEQWTSGLAQLRSRGLSEEVINALGLGDSPEALAQVQAFSSATQTEIDELNSAVAARTQAAGTKVAQEQTELFSKLGAGLAGIRRQLNDEIEKANLELSRELAEATEELGRIGKEQGQSYGDAIAAGINSSIPAIQAAAAHARAAMGELEAADRAVTGRSSGPFKGSVGAGLGSPGMSAPGAPPRGTAGSFTLNGQTVHVNAAGIIDTPGPSYGMYPAQVPGVQSAQPMTTTAAASPWTGYGTTYEQHMAAGRAAGITETTDAAGTINQAYLDWQTGVNRTQINDGGQTYDIIGNPTFRTYDSGGLLPAKSTVVATNMTGEDEYVLRKAQLAVFGQLAARVHQPQSSGQAINVTYEVNAQGAVEGTAKLITSALEEHTEALLRVVGAGVG